MAMCCCSCARSRQLPASSGACSDALDSFSSASSTTALMRAAVASAPKCVALLWQAQADLDATDKHGRCSIVLAASEGGKDYGGRKAKIWQVGLRLPTAVATR